MPGKIGHFGRRGRAAFSVVELMLAVAIMGVIVYALFLVFNQTQKALRSTETQGDVSEKARAIMEIVSRELAQAHPSFEAYLIDDGVGTNWVNEVNLFSSPEFTPRVQNMPDRRDIEARTNVLYNLFFYNAANNQWTGIGYRVIDVDHGVGELVRYQREFTNYTGIVHGPPETNLVSTAFVNEPKASTNYNHVADGVIHFKVTAYDGEGYQYHFTSPRTNLNYRVWKVGSGAGAQSPGTTLENATVLLQQTFPGWNETSVSFASNAMPAYVEVELAMLEPETLRQFYTMVEDQNPNATNFLSKQIGKVHLFRERIPIRTAAQ